MSRANGIATPAMNINRGKMRSSKWNPSHVTWCCCSAHQFSQFQLVVLARATDSSPPPMIHSISNPRRASRERRRGVGVGCFMVENQSKLVRLYLSGLRPDRYILIT